MSDGVLLAGYTATARLCGCAEEMCKIAGSTVFRVFAIPAEGGVMC